MCREARSPPVTFKWSHFFLTVFFVFEARFRLWQRRFCDFSEFDLYIITIGPRQKLGHFSTRLQHFRRTKCDFAEFHNWKHTVTTLEDSHDFLNHAMSDSHISEKWYLQNFIRKYPQDILENLFLKGGSFECSIWFKKKKRRPQRIACSELKRRDPAVQLRCVSRGTRGGDENVSKCTFCCRWWLRT